MKLVIDIGNTLTKLAVFEKDNMLTLKATDDFNTRVMSEIIDEFPMIHTSILSSVKNIDDNIFGYLESRMKSIVLDHHTHLPFSNNYQTPETLGRDRLAGVAGGMQLFPESNIMVIDAGTCITYDIITDDNNYLGGGISPGITMRFKALNSYTGKLPLMEFKPEGVIELTGNNTNSSLLSGVQNGVLAEVDGIIDRYKKRFYELKVVVTGGDYKYFDKYLKNNIFAAPNLVLIGLNKILDFNEGN